MGTISRRNFLASTAGAAAGLAAAGAVSARSLDSEKPPNFVFIYTDDQGYQDLGCFGSPDIKTPVIDRMAAEGAKFTSFYAAPVCTPSRAALLTGCHPRRAGFPGQALVVFPGHEEGLHPQEVTIADMLRTKGYATACYGKWHLGHEPNLLPPNQGFDEFFGFPYSNDMNPDYLIEGTERIEDNPDQSTLTKRYTDRTINFIQENKEKPFFVYLAHTMPHVPLYASDEFEGTSERGLYGDVMEEMDWHVGRILQTLKDEGLEDNTYVVFTSDNGPWLQKGDEGGSALPLNKGKNTLYEGGVRVPCVMYAPGRIPGGLVCDEIASIIDVLPTFASLAGVDLDNVLPQTVLNDLGEEIPYLIDGHDISDLVHGVEGAVTPHQEGLIFFNGGGKPRAIRRGKWKYHYKRNLYNLEEDIGETTDVGGDNKELREELKKALEDISDEVIANARPLGTSESTAALPRPRSTFLTRRSAARRSGTVYDARGRKVDPDKKITNKLLDLIKIKK